MASFASLNSPIGLWNIPLTVSEFRKTIFDALTDSKTLVVLDTNVLALPFRLHRRARQGFYRLLNKPVQDGRVVVPA